MKNILWDILMIDIGVVLIMFPGTAIDISIKVIGVILIVAGAAGVVLGIKWRKAKIAKAEAAEKSVNDEVRNS